MDLWWNRLGFLKLKFHDSSFPRSIINRDILARMSLTSHEEIGRVWRVGWGCYEDPREDPHENVCNKSCVSCSGTLENDTDIRTNGQHYTSADHQLTNQVSAWQAGRGSRRTCKDVCKVSVKSCVSVINASINRHQLQYEYL